MINDIKKLPAALEYAPDSSYRMEYMSGVDGLRDWAIVCPYKTSTWIVNLHGHGSHGDQLFTREDIRNAWLPKFLSLGAGIICPNLRDNAWMCPSAARDMHDLLDYLRSEHDASRFIFFGGSMGGTGNLMYATLHPEDVDACITLGAATEYASFYNWCRQQPNKSTPQQLADAIENSYGQKPAANIDVFKKHSTLENCSRLTMPVFFAHGEADKLIPVEQARMLADKMAAFKNFTYHEIPGGDHDSPLVILESMDFMRIFLKSF